MRLDQALAWSLLLHGVLLLVPPPVASTSAQAQPLRVTLAPRLAPAPLPQAMLTLPEDEPQAVAAPQAPRLPRSPEPTGRRAGDLRPPVAAPRPGPAVSQPLAEQLARELLYPAAAIARGLEGEALVLLIFDADGRVRSASIEQSSGYALLDQAALRAARRLRAPPDAAAETLLPVRFRLID